MDKETFVQLMESRADSLYRVTWAILENNADAADALQETALRAWQHRGSLRSTAYFGTWATRICINVCRRMLRSAIRSYPWTLSRNPPVLRRIQRFPCPFGHCRQICAYR